MGATSREKKLKGPPATLDGDHGRQPRQVFPFLFWWVRRAPTSPLLGCEILREEGVLPGHIGSWWYMAACPYSYWP
jgi:hypothetical protein